MKWLLPWLMWMFICLGLFAAFQNAERRQKEAEKQITILSIDVDQENFINVVYLDSKGKRWASDMLTQEEFHNRFGILITSYQSEKNVK